MPAILKNGGHLEKYCILIELTQQQYTGLSHSDMLLAKTLKPFGCMSRENQTKISRNAPKPRPPIKKQTTIFVATTIKLYLRAANVPETSL